MKAQATLRVPVVRGIDPPGCVLRDIVARAARGDGTGRASARFRAWESGTPDASRLTRFGVVKQYDSPDTLLIDHDWPECPDVQGFRVELARMRVPVEALSYERSAHGWHITVKLKRKYPLFVRIALQLALGSDRTREQYNLMRAMQRPGPFWARRSNVLYSRSIYAGAPRPTEKDGAHGRARDGECASSIQSRAGKGKADTLRARGEGATDGSAPQSRRALAR